MSAPRSSTETLARALEMIAPHIQTDDGLVSAAIAEAAQRLREQAEVITDATTFLSEHEDQAKWFARQWPQSSRDSLRLIAVLDRLRAVDARTPSRPPREGDSESTDRAEQAAAGGRAHSTTQTTR